MSKELEEALTRYSERLNWVDDYYDDVLREIAPLVRLESKALELACQTLIDHGIKYYESDTAETWAERFRGQANVKSK